MKRSGETGMWFIAWAVGAFVLCMVALFSMFGGLILAVLMVAATPFVLGFLVVEAIFGKRPVYVTSWKAEEAGAAARPEGRVSARVIGVEGVCPRGYQFDVGDIWSIDGRAEGARPLCATAEMLLRSAAAQLKEGQASVEEVRCVGPEHRVVFALQSERSRAIPSPHQQLSQGVAKAGSSDAA